MASAGPEQVEVGPAAARGEAEPEGWAARGLAEAVGEEGQRLGQREAVDAEPEAVVDLGAGDRLAGLGLDALGGGGDEVRPEHLLQRPAGQQILRGVGGEVGEARAHGVDLVAHHGVEALALGGLQVGIVEHVEGGPHAGERCPARLGQLDQPVVAARLGGIVVGDVVEQQHVAAEGGVAFAGPHRRQADLEEVAGRRGGDELRGRGGLAAGDAALDGFAGVVDQGAVDHRVDRPAEADQLGAAGAVGGAREPAEQGAGAAVVEQDPPVEVADDDALVQLGHQRRRAGRARAPPCGWRPRPAAPCRREATAAGRRAG